MTKSSANCGDILIVDDTPERQTKLHHTSEVAPTLTLSIGVSVAFPSESLSPAKLNEAADKALYRAKDAGRSCLKQFTLK